MKRNPHPARGSRITALGVSASAFVSIVTSLAWNTHQVELAANVTDVNTGALGQTTLAPGTTTPLVSGVPTSGTPAATIAPKSPAAPNAPAPKNNVSTPTKTNKNSTPAAPKVAPAKPVTPAAPTTAAPAPAKPVAAVVYTCMSPGGTTQNPTSSGNCQSGYTLTKI